MATKKITPPQYNAFKSAMDRANDPTELLDIASEHGYGLTANELERAKEYAMREVQSEIARRIGSEEQAALAADLREIANRGIQESSRFISWVIYRFSIAAVIVLFAGEVLRLTPAIAKMLQTNWILAVVPTAMLLIGYYVSSLVGKHERKRFQHIIITKRDKSLHKKYMEAENITPDEEREGKRIAELMRNRRRAGLGYGITEWVLFAGMHAITAAHTLDSKEFTGLLLIESVGFIFLLLVVSKMLVGHIFVTSLKPIETGVQGFDEQDAFDTAYGSAIYRSIISKASRNVEGENKQINFPQPQAVNER